jgi:shikimate dehydrogenase
VAQILHFGILGHPLSHSLSPRLHRAAFEFSGLAGDYQLFDVSPDRLTQWMQDLQKNEINGFNVTIPHKQTLFRLVHVHTAQAEQVGALNVVKVTEDGRLEGHNTDYDGLKFSLEQNHPGSFSGKSALLLGAGGAALAAAAVVKSLAFSHLRVLARDPAKRQSFMEFVKRRFTTSDPNAQDMPPKVEADQPNLRENAALVINATSVGLTDAPPPSWMKELVAQLPQDCICVDLVYRKDRSLPTFAWLANERGLKSLDGIDMLVQQAKLSFEYWTGISVPFEHMKAAI